MSDGIDLVSGARDMILATACSLQAPKALYRSGANREASNFLGRVQWGQTEHGSFGLTLLPPVVPPPLQPPLDENWASEDDPPERRMTRRLAEALDATSKAIERTIGGDREAFHQAIRLGASANLCEALVKLITPFPTLDISLVWARTRPMKTARHTFKFARTEVSILQEVARTFREQEPQFDVRLFGFVERLKREEEETDGTITFRAFIGDQVRSVMAVLSQSDYLFAIEAHKSKDPIIIEGDLEHVGRRWRVLNTNIVEVVRSEDLVDGEGTPTSREEAKPM